MAKSTGENRPHYMKNYKQSYSKRKRQVNISFDVEEYKQLEVQAKKEDIRVSALVKSLVLEQMNGTPRAVLSIPKLNESTAKELTRLMRTMANNFNQVAHHMNMSAHLDGYTSTINPEVAIGEMYKQLQQMEKKITAALTQRSNYDH